MQRILLLALLFISATVAGCVQRDIATDLETHLLESAPAGWYFVQETTSGATGPAADDLPGGVSAAGRPPIAGAYQTFGTEEGAGTVSVTVARYQGSADALHAHAQVAGRGVGLAVHGCPLAFMIAWVEDDVALTAIGFGAADMDQFQGLENPQARQQYSTQIGTDCPPPGQQPTVPQITFMTEEQAGRIRVETAPPTVDWSEYFVRSLSGTVHVAQDGDADEGSQAIDHLPFMIPAGTIEAAAFLDFCAPGAASHVEIHLVHNATNSLVHRTVFSSLPVC